jgi:hypothetical protein
MPGFGFEPMTSAIARAKTVNALDRVANVITFNYRNYVSEKGEQIHAQPLWTRYGLPKNIKHTGYNLCSKM